MSLEFSIGVRLTHFFNFLFLSLLVRSGIEILGAHPKLYWRDHCSVGGEWIRFTHKKAMPSDTLWTAEDEIKSLPPWIALPGRNNLGLGRHWHFWSVTGWVLCGLAYIVTIIATSEWRRLVPTSWSMFIGHGFAAGMARIVLGGEGRSHSLAVLLGVCGILLVIALNIVATRSSLRWPVITKRLLEVGIDPLKRLMFHHWSSRQGHGFASPYARVNGRPPKNETYARSLAAGFEDWRLRVDGLVEAPLCLSLAELRAMPHDTQSTLHVCIQGWTYFAAWTGVRVAHLLEEARPKPAARYLVFHTLDEKWERPGHGNYYEVIDLETARKPQVILAYGTNGAQLPVEHGAPLRLRVEHQLGYKMAKWVHRIELVEDFRDIGKGQGGWRDDVLNYYPSDAGI